MQGQWSGGKGSKRRPEDKKKFDDNWDKIFGKKDYNSTVKQNDTTKGKKQ